MNELQKDYFEKMQKEQAEAEAAEEARLLAVMESERKKEAIKQEIEKKAKEEAERKAEEEAVEIINRVKAEMASKKAKQAEEKKQEEDKQSTEADQNAADKNKEAEMQDAKKEKSEVDVTEDVKIQEKARTGPLEEDKEKNIYEQEPAGEASMPKKGPKFKKGNRKGGTGGGQSKLQETAAAKDQKENRSTEAGQNVETDISQEEAVEKATPESKAASDREAKLQELADEYQDKYKRLLAEFENARAREAKEASRMYDVGAKAVLEKLLPIVDNFERAIQTIPEEDKERAFEQGVDKIYKQMMTILEEIGVQPMNAEGTEFNPDMHNAVMHVEDEAFGENVVAEEMQKGYMYKDSVLRYSMVKVAN